MSCIRALDHHPRIVVSIYIVSGDNMMSFERVQHLFHNLSVEGLKGLVTAVHLSIGAVVCSVMYYITKTCVDVAPVVLGFDDVPPGVGVFIYSPFHIDIWMCGERHGCHQCLCVYAICSQHLRNICTWSVSTELYHSQNIVYCIQVC